MRMYAHLSGGYALTPLQRDSSRAGYALHRQKTVKRSE
jgi:hypothetical protein